MSAASTGPLPHARSPSGRFLLAVAAGGAAGASLRAALLGLTTVTLLRW